MAEVLRGEIGSMKEAIDRLDAVFPVAGHYEHVVYNGRVVISRWGRLPNMCLLH